LVSLAGKLKKNVTKNN